MLMCDETITVYRLKHDAATDRDSYERTVIKGASWYGKAAVKVEARGLVSADVVKLRIPANSLPAGWLPKKGDYIAHGETGGITRVADLEGIEHIQVMEVGDNRRGGLPHVAVTGT